MKVELKTFDRAAAEAGDRPLLGKAVIRPETPEDEESLRRFKARCKLRDPHVPRLSVAFWEPREPAQGGDG